MDNAADQPHKAILLIKLEVHNILPTGECSGRPVTVAELKQYNLRPAFTKTVNGFDRHECLRKLSEILNQLENN